MKDIKIEGIACFGYESIKTSKTLKDWLSKTERVLTHLETREQILEDVFYMVHPRKKQVIEPKEEVKE